MKNQTAKLMAVMILAAGVALSALNTYDGKTRTTITSPTVVTATNDLVSATYGVDVHELKGVATVLVSIDADANASQSVTATLQHGSVTNSYTDVSGMTTTVTNSAAITAWRVDTGTLKRYVRMYYTNHYGSATAPVSAVIIGY